MLFQKRKVRFVISKKNPSNNCCTNHVKTVHHVLICISIAEIMQTVIQIYISKQFTGTIFKDREIIYHEVIINDHNLLSGQCMEMVNLIAVYWNAVIIHLKK